MGEVLLSFDIKRLFLALLRELFALDTDFTYNNDDKVNSSLVISTSYALNALENKLPQVIVSGASYTTVGEDSISQGFHQEIPLTSNRNVVDSRKYTKIVNFQVTIDVLSTVRGECEKLADKVFNIINHIGNYILINEGFFTTSISVSEPTIKQQYPQYSFVSSIVVTGSSRLVWTVSNLDKQLLQNIKLALTIEDYDKL